MSVKFDCPDCYSKKSLKVIDSVNHSVYVKRLYECSICKERYSSKETLLKKSNSLIKPKGGKK